MLYIMTVHFREGLREAGSEGKISQEVIEEQFAIVLSRDYASLLGLYVRMCGACICVLSLYLCILMPILLILWYYSHCQYHCVCVTIWIHCVLSYDTRLCAIIMLTHT